MAQRVCRFQLHYRAVGSAGFEVFSHCCPPSGSVPPSYQEHPMCATGTGWDTAPVMLTEQVLHCKR